MKINMVSMQANVAVEDFAFRLERLEIENRKLRLMLGGLLFVALMALLGASAVQDAKTVEEVRAKRFLLVGESGEVRAMLATRGRLAALDLYATDAGVSSQEGAVSLTASDNGCQVSVGTGPYARIATMTPIGKRRLMDDTNRAAAEVAKFAPEVYAQTRAAVDQIPLVEFSLGSKNISEDISKRIDPAILSLSGVKVLEPGTTTFSVGIRGDESLLLRGGRPRSIGFALEASPREGSTIRLEAEGGRADMALLSRPFGAPDRGAAASRPSSSIVFWDALGQVLTRLPR